MNSATRRSPGERDRAIARLRALTLGTGLAGVAAVGGFGALAAATYDGTSTTDGAITAAVSTDTTTGATSTTSGSSTATSSTTSTSTTTTSTATTSGLSTTTTPTTTTGSAHASTGGS